VFTACAGTDEAKTKEADMNVEAGSENEDNSSEITDDTSQDETETNVDESSEEYEIKQLSEGDKAPDFTAELADGTEFHLADHSDKVVILNFFASWCGPCMNEMPAFQMLMDDNNPNLKILCVDCMEEKAIVDALIKEKGYAFPIAYDENGDIGMKYPTDGIPYTLIIKNGVIENIFVGASGAEEQYAEYKKAIDACMK